MSARVSRVVPPKGAGRGLRRKMALDVDLNAPAPTAENGDEVGTSSHAPAQPVEQPVQQGAPLQPVTIDVDLLDDDVVLSSPRAFQEAKNNARRNRSRNNVVDIDLESTAGFAANNRTKRQRFPTNQPIINCESYVPVQTVNGVRANDRIVMQQIAGMMSPPPPPEPTFSCPVCMGPLVEEMSTKCGHIFCKACIKQAITAQSKCPTCRRKVTMKDTIRIYLPATS